MRDIKGGFVDFIEMPKKRKSLPKEERRRLRQRKLDQHNIDSYFSDIDYLGRLRVSEATRSWIEARMYEHRDKANVYEHNFAEFLLDNKINFIHQAPFVFYGKKIYFADFFLPDFHLVVEIDGDYHNGLTQYAYDKERENNFASVKVKTLRISNNTTKNKNALALLLAKYGINTKS